MHTVQTLLKDAINSLNSLETARLDAEVLLATVLDVERSKLYAFPEKSISDSECADFRSLLARRCEGFPIAYLTGKKEFWSLSLSVTQDTLIPRPETEHLVELALTLIPLNKTMRILELGTGSGAIAIAIAKERPDCRILATDISAKALSVADSNIKAQQLNNIELKESDWFSRLGRKSFDLILSNPPYVGSQDHRLNQDEIRFEPRLALDGGHQGMQAINSLVPCAKQYLNQGAWLMLEHGYEQGSDIRRLFELHHYTQIQTRADLADLERVSMGRML